jgi:hypothetical protein
VTGPPLSVAMPVRNARPYLTQSLASIREQTFADFEFVIVDDASTDGSTELLRRAARADERVKLVERSESTGSVGAFNEVVARCSASLIARMDADDVSRPRRLELQLEAMHSNPDVVLAGTLADGIDARGRQSRPRDRWRLVRCDTSPFPHGSAMFRRHAFDRIGGYRPTAGEWADLDLFVRLGEQGRVVVLPEALYRYRYHVSSSTLTQPDEHAAREVEAMRSLLAECRPGRTIPDPRPALTEPSREAMAAVGRARAALRLWAGETPPRPRDLWASGALRATPAGVGALVRSAWGSVSPGTLRAVLRASIRARDAIAGVWVKDGEPREWRFG